MKKMKKAVIIKEQFRTKLFFKEIGVVFKVQNRNKNTEYFVKFESNNVWTFTRDQFNDIFIPAE